MLQTSRAIFKPISPSSSLLIPNVTLSSSSAFAFKKFSTLSSLQSVKYQILGQNKHTLPLVQQISQLIPQQRPRFFSTRTSPLIPQHKLPTQHNKIQVRNYRIKISASDSGDPQKSSIFKKILKAVAYIVGGAVLVVVALVSGALIIVLGIIKRYLYRFVFRQFRKDVSWQVDKNRQKIERALGGTFEYASTANMAVSFLTKPAVLKGLDEIVGPLGSGTIRAEATVERNKKQWWKIDTNLELVTFTYTNESLQSPASMMPFDMLVLYDPNHKIPFSDNKDTDAADHPGEHAPEIIDAEVVSVTDVTPDPAPKQSKKHKQPSHKKN